MLNKNSVLNKVFPNNTFDIEYFINNVSSMTCPNSNYELEIRIVDAPNNVSCSLETYNRFPMDGDGFRQLLYSDEIEKSLYSPIIGVRVRSKLNSDVYEKKTNITTLANFKRNEQMSLSGSSTDRILPIIIKFNIEQSYTTYEQDNKTTVVGSVGSFQRSEAVGSFQRSEAVGSFQRKQRISYCSNVPLLRNWRIDKTVRFYANDINDMKLSFKLTPNNVINPYYYDALDIEFEYVGDYNEFTNSLFKLFEYIYKDDFKTFNLTYNEINTILHNKYSVNLSSISSEVGIITNNFISNSVLTEYVYEEKFDGDKVSLIVYKDNIYEYTKKYFKSVHNDNIDRELTIVDCEKVSMPNGTTLYIVFDCLIHNGRWLNEYDYITRLKYCKLFVDDYKSILNCYRPKCYTLSADKWSNLLMLVETHKQSRELKGVNIDGLILHKKHTPFINGELYKLKNSGLMTTDFLLKWIEEKQLYYIYTIGFPSEVKRRCSIINPYSDKHFGYSLIGRSDSSYILFDNPYIFNIYEFKPNKDWLEPNNDNNRYYTDEQINNINELVNDMLTKPLTYNGKIVELSLYKKTNSFYTWLPMRVRNDKIYPNGYRIGISNIETIYNRLSIESTMDKVNGCDQNSINKLYKQLIDKLGLNKTSPINIVINIAANTTIANDICRYLNVGNIYYISKNKTPLVNNLNNIQSDSNNIIDFSCIHYDDISTLYTKLLYSSFVPKSVNLFIDTEGINTTSLNNQLTNIISHNGIYIDVINKEYKVIS